MSLLENLMIFADDALEFCGFLEALETWTIFFKSSSLQTLNLRSLGSLNYVSSSLQKIWGAWWAFGFDEILEFEEVLGLENLLNWRIWNGRLWNWRLRIEEPLDWRTSGLKNLWIEDSGIEEAPNWRVSGTWRISENWRLSGLKKLCSCSCSWCDFSFSLEPFI